MSRQQDGSKTMTLLSVICLHFLTGGSSGFAATRFRLSTGTGACFISQSIGEADFTSFLTTYIRSALSHLNSSLQGICRPPCGKSTEY